MKKFIKKHDNQSDYQNLLENYNYVLVKWKNLSNDYRKGGLDNIRHKSQFFNFVNDSLALPLEIITRRLNSYVEEDK